MTPIKAEIHSRMDGMTPAERKVARALLANYPSAGLASAASLAKTAGTSSPTVLRLVTRLGLAGYPEFQARLREEITLESRSPVHRAEHGEPDPAINAELNAFVLPRRELLERMVSMVPASEFDRLVKLLAAQPRAVLISGGYYSVNLAELLALQLDQIIPNVSLAREPFGRDSGKYLDLKKNAVVIIFDFRRHEMASTKVAQQAKQSGATVVVITDQELSPSAADADIVLPVPVDGIPFDSFIGLMVLVEAIVEATFRQTRDSGLKRMKNWEENIHAYRAFAATPHPEEES
ncbi:DNA-binding MurR/RpiR family transcriptional regulator [Arthrobacter silviterrae]|uniref:MurR/RpiR family transcriptional regulator n=1 Tax=Arthrobacter silviterrae TaxID=2026658 RepID=A0ABX0D5M3_9MICC|nr:MurR/RpiR family transcriptional regulator [Arthrobacter silviterrae]MDQ0278554.1 DNA-binding MurR/RpiR family transcriptional regulator [Arthrobacter silviterrae]NGN82189.1 MurR/RpiR family transcriptional regulator [Arthrobacter silviterrae]